MHVEAAAAPHGHALARQLEARPPRRQIARRHEPCAHATDDDTPAPDEPPDDASAGPKPEPPAAAAPVQ